jgi:hypothetical protein
MSEWWHGLSLSLQIFHGIGILATVILVVQLVMTLFGVDSDGSTDAGGFDGQVDFGGVDGNLDVDQPADLAEHGSGLQILSVRSVVAFLAGFGWTGVIVLQAGRGIGSAVLVAVGVGTLLMLLVFWLMRWLYSLRESGTMDYRNAVGQVGTVYVRIPAAGQGTGQIKVLVQGRLATVAATVCRGDTIPSGDKVRVTGLAGANILEVEGIQG